MLRRVVAERLWGEQDFFLIDVGASGGIKSRWRTFGDRLRAIGFDPLTAEVDRLNAQARGTKVAYEAAFVTCRDYEALFPAAVRADRLATRDNGSFARSSASRALEVMRLNYREQVYNAGAPVACTDRRITLDDWLGAERYASVDFVKVDTDGHDVEVLLGAEGLLRAGGALGLAIELQFHGAQHEHANTFANIDRLMRAHGFSLFDLDVYRYSRAALPAPFVYDFPAQTQAGQVTSGDGVYFRDLADADYQRMWGYEITRERVLKLACLFELYGLPDCAAELLVRHRRIVGDVGDSLLDILAGGKSAPPGTYGATVRRFEEDPTAWYSSRGTGRAGIAPARPLDPNADALKAKIVRLQKKMVDVQDRVRRRDEQIARLTRQLAARTSAKG